VDLREYLKSTSEKACAWWKAHQPSGGSPFFVCPLLGFLRSSMQPTHDDFLLSCVVLAVQDSDIAGCLLSIERS